MAAADGNKLLINGDLNIDYNQHGTKSMKQIKKIEREFNLEQHIKETTCAATTSDSLIDHIYSNISDVTHSGVIQTTISDHYMTYVIIKKQPVKYGTTSFTCRITKNLKYEKLEEELQNQNWEDFYQTTDPTKCWNIMYSLFLNVLDNLCPEKTFKEVRKRSEWITLYLFEIMIRRDALFKEAKSKKDNDKWAEAKQFRNTVNEACKNAKSDFIKKSLDEEKSDPRKFWNRLKPLCSTKSKGEIENIELRGCDTKQEVANAFNTFFLSIGEELKNKITPLNAMEKLTLEGEQTSRNVGRPESQSADTE